MKRSKRILALFLSMVLLLGMLPMSALAADSTFSDVKTSDWFYDDVRYVCENGLMNGTGSGTFSPKATTTRGMIVTILYRLSGEPAVSGVCPFGDVAAGKYYEKAITWAEENKIVSGYADGTFGPDNAITREQLAAILYRYATFCGYAVTASAEISRFADAGTVGSYALAAMKWASAEGLINGSGSKLDPKGGATRAQVAAILARFCKNIAGISTPASKPASGTGTILPPAPNPTPDPDPTPDPGPKPDPEPDPDPSDAEDFYKENAELIDIIDAKKSDDVLTEADVKSNLEEKGFTEYPITYMYTMDGEKVEETEISDNSTIKHPMYQTFYLSESNNIVWLIYVVNGEVFADPVSFNWEYDLNSEILVSTSERLTSYDDETNRFYITKPFASRVLVKIVEQIDAATLENLTAEELCAWSGAAMPPTDNDDDSDNDSTVSESSMAETVDLLTEETAGLSDATVQSSSDPIIMVSLGDSYSSGEGIEKFYGQDKSLFEKVEDEDWLAHRSTRSWPGMLRIPGVAGTMSNYKVDVGKTSEAPIQWYFAAASGAETVNFKAKEGETEEEQGKLKKDIFQFYYKNIIVGTVPYKDCKYLPCQLDVFNKIRGEVDYVTVTVGGNDVDFADIVKDCAMGSSYLNFNWFKKTFDKRIADIWNKEEQWTRNIENTYDDIQQAAGNQAAIIVAGYPKLFEKTGKGFLISEEEATTVNENVTKFNNKLKELVEGRQRSGMNIYFVDVEREFDGHEAYSSSEWINRIIIPKKSEDLEQTGFGSAYSVHPNEKGARAYARCVNAKIAEIERRKTISGVITIADEDTDMTNNVPLKGAEVELWISQAEFRNAKSDSNGEYKLVDVPAGTYTLRVSKEGYFPVTETITVTEDDSEIIYNITIEAISEEYAGFGQARGKIIDAGTGRGVSGLTLYIRPGIGNTAGEAAATINMTESTYTTPMLISGNYTVQIVDEREGITDEERYVTSTFNIKVLGDKLIDNQNGYVSNGVMSEEIRIVLTWGESPSDLDSHLVGPTENGDKFHVYYGNKVHGTEADLDVDDTSSYGPETITIHSFNEGIYTYAIHDYSNRYSSNSTALANSGAQVKVYIGAKLLMTYNVPSNKDGTLWTVFTYNSKTKQFTTVNTMSYDSTPGGSLLSTESIGVRLDEKIANIDFIDATALLVEDILRNPKHD